MMKKRAGFLMISLLLLALCGCGQLATETSPFSEDPEQKDSERLNGWPVYYRSGARMSFLWPFVQVNDDAHALWPVYQWDGDEKRLSLGSGVVADLGFKEGNYRIASIAWEPGDRFFVIFPVYFQKLGDDPWFCLVPAFYYHQREMDTDVFVSLPFSRWRNGFSIAGPVLAQWRADNGAELDRLRTLALAGLVYDSKTIDNAERRSWVLPLWYANRKGEADNPESRTRVVFPLVARVERPGLRWTLTPLASWGRSQEDNGTFLNLGGILFHQKRSDKGRFVLGTPLFAGWKWNEDEGVKRSGYMALPLVYSDTRRDADGKVIEKKWLNPIWAYGSEGEKIDWWTFGTLLAQYGRNGRNTQFNTLLFDYKKMVYQGDPSPVQTVHRTWKSILSLISYQTIDGDFHATHFFPLYGIQPRSFTSLPVRYANRIPQGEQREKLMGMLHAATEQQEAARARFPKDWWFMMFINGSKTEIWANAQDEAGNWYVPEDPVREKREWRVFPLLHRENVEGGRKSFSVLPFGLLWKNAKTPATEEEPAKVKRRFLWRIYDHEQTGDEVSTDVFPFISLDANKRANFHQWSWLGPVLRRTSSDDRVSWQILGIRFGGQDTGPAQPEAPASN